MQDGGRAAGPVPPPGTLDGASPIRRPTLNDDRGFAAFDTAVRSPCLDREAVGIRAAAADDLPLLAQLAVAENRRSPSDGRASTSLAYWRDLFLDNLGRDDRHVTVAEAGTDLVGYARTGWFEPEPTAPPNTAPAGWYLMGLSVDPDWRRRGIARALTQERLDWVAARADHAWYFANERNRVSLALHASLGFIEVTRDFSFPGVGFRGGTGVLCRVDLDARP